MSDLSTVHDIDEAVTQRIGDGNNFDSIVDGKPFRATFNQPKDLVMVFLPGRSTKGTTVRPTERIALWRLWQASKSFDPQDFKDVSKSAEFLLSVLSHVAPVEAAAAAEAKAAAAKAAAAEKAEKAAKEAAEEAEIEARNAPPAAAATIVADESEDSAEKVTASTGEEE